MIIAVANEQIDLPLDDEAVPVIVREIISSEGVKTDEISVNFVDQSAICSLHKKYFNDASLTDCISFPIDSGAQESYHVLGEVFVCPFAAVKYANDTGCDPYDEALLYMIHGLLHLMGYDDISEEDRLKMRDAEKRHLLNLKNLDLDLRLK